MLAAIWRRVFLPEVVLGVKVDGLTGGDGQSTLYTWRPKGIGTW